MSNKILISLFDYTGNASRPFKEAGWKCMQIDKQLGIDIFEWDYVRWWNENRCSNVGIIAMIPCTDYALSGARHFAKKDADGTTNESQKLVQRTKDIITFFENLGVLKF